ncbi:hypothetical protein EDD22DRAFT_905810 [Suillus occidentalis]|nr:hypothetical protein EDD22DRAFT_905810 [Suillus occidentalis]
MLTGNFRYNILCALFSIPVLLLLRSRPGSSRVHLHPPLMAQKSCEKDEDDMVLLGRAGSWISFFECRKRSFALCK